MVSSGLDVEHGTSHDVAERSSTLIVRRTRGLRWTMLAFTAATAAGLLLVGLGPRPVGIILGTPLIAGSGAPWAQS